MMSEPMEQAPVPALADGKTQICPTVNTHCPHHIPVGEMWCDVYFVAGCMSPEKATLQQWLQKQPNSHIIKYTDTITSI